MEIVIVCKDGMRFSRDLEPQAGAVSCIVGFDCIVAKDAKRLDGETKFPIYEEIDRVSLK